MRKKTLATFVVVTVALGLVLRRRPSRKERPYC